MTTSTRSARPTKKPAKATPATTAPRARRVQPPAGGHDALAGATHVTPAGGSVFADLGFTRDEAANLEVRAQLMHEVRCLVDARGLTQA